MNIKLGHKAGSGSQRKPVTAPDSASSKSYARIVYGINDGHMVGFIDGLKSLILDNTPVQSSSGEMNISEVEVQTRWGTNDQDYLEGFPSVVNEIGYSNVEIVSDHSFVHYVNDLNTNAVGLRFTWGKIFRQDESNGDVNGYRIDYAVDVQTDGNGFVEVLKTSLNDKTSSGYERYHRLELPPAEVGWEIRVRRLTPNATSDFIGDKMFLSAVAEIVDAKLRYPNTALIALKFDADKFGSIPKADFRLRGKIIKVPTNYDTETRTYAVTGEGTTNGIWDGSFKLAYTNNPVWVFYDLLLSKRYGLGERLDASMVDKWALYGIGQYCDVMVPDGLGGTEPRLTCNVYINSKYEAFDLLMQLASTFRGILHWDGASIVATADRPSDPVFTFTRANIIGEFNYSGTRARDRSSMISVAFDDPANNYKTDKEVVSDTNAIAEVGVRLKELTAFGCTSRGQAQRIGRLGLLKEQQELRMVTFTAGLDGYIPVTGKIIEIADPLLAGRAIGGRISVVSADGLVITLDREVTANVGDVLVANGDDGIQQRRDITQVNGKVVTVSAAFSGVSAENVWAIDSEDLSLMRFRVLSVAQNRSDDGLITFTISGAQHNPTIDEGADFSAYIEQPTYSNIEIYTQVAPTELVIGSENVINQGLDITNVVFSWPQAVNAVKYELEWRRDNGSWIKAPIIYSNTFAVEDVYHGLYEARIVAINSMDVRSLYTVAQPTTINSKFAEPPMLSFIQATGVQFGAEISWVFPARESQNAEYVEVQISFREDKSDAKLLGNYAYPLNRAEINGLHANLRLWVKARIIDRNKVEGPWTVWVSTTTDAEASILLDALSGKLTSSQLDQDLTTDIATGVAADVKAVAAKLAADAAAQAAATAQTAANTAGTAASNAQTTANTAKRTAEQAKADITALTTSTNTTATELRDRLTTAENGLTQEKLDRASGDDAVVGQLNTYKSSNDAALAAVQQKAEAATTSSTANAQALTNLTATVNTKNRTYRQTTAPTAGLVLGDLWINTTVGKNNEVRRWNGTAWDDLTDPRTAANATALTNLQTTVTAIDGRTTANANSITQLRTDLTTLSNNVDAKADASAVDSLTTRVTTAEGNITSQGSRVTSLENRVNHATTGLASKASSSALTATNSEVTRINGVVTGHTNQLTQLASDITTINGNLATKADASALNDIYTKTQAAAKATEIAAGEISKYDASLIIGGDNLASNSDKPVWGTHGGSVLTQVDGIANTTLKTKKAIRVSSTGGSATIKAVRDISALELSAQVVMSVRIQNIGTTPIAVRCNGIENHIKDPYTLTLNAGEFKYFEWVGVTRHNYAFIQLIIESTDISHNTSFEVSDLKVEYGTKATSWTPSSLDVQAGINANASAISTTNTEVSRINGVVTSQGTSITNLQAGLTAANNSIATKADGSALSTLTTRVTNAEGVNTSQGSAITNLENTVNHATTGLASKASSAALTTLDNKVTTIDGKVTTNASNITTLQGKVTTVENGLSTKADGSALSALTTRVSNAEGSISTQSSKTTALEAKISSFKAAGRNYLLDSKSAGTKNINPEINTILAPTSIVRMSFDIEIRTPVQAGLRNRIGFEGDFAVSGTTYYFGVWLANASSVGAGKRRVYNTYILPSSWTAGVSTFPSTFPYHNQTSGGDFTVSNIKLEVGDAYTDWTPAPEDNASASALSTLDTKVTAIDGRVTSNSSSITSLNNSLTTTNTNVTAAQTAATNAMTAAGQKGKVIFGTAVPVAADQLSQNLWIDTTGNANTPKRWNGTAWVAVTDKVATDAAAAAANALSVAQTKADASALTSLNTKVDTIDGKVTAQATDILNLNSSLANLNNTKLDAAVIQQYRTAVDQDSVTAGELTQFKSALKIGGDNLFTGTKTFNNQATENSTSSFYPSYGGFGGNTQEFLPSALFGTHTVVKTSSSWCGFYLREADGVSWEAQEDMVLSFWARADDADVYVHNITSRLGLVATIPANQPMTKYEVLIPKGKPLRNASNQGIIEFHFPNGGELWYGAVMLQVGTKSTSWQPSSKDNDLDTSQFASATALENLTTNVSNIDGKVAALAQQTNTLSTTVGNNTASIQLQQTSIDGINAKATLQVEAGGTIGGVALGNNGGVVDFLVRSNTFAVAPPVGYSGSNKYLMTYRATPITLPNGTVVSEGLYLNNLAVGYIDASKIYADSLSAVSATLGTLITYKNPANPSGARMVLEGSLIRVYDDNNVMRVRMGLW